MSTRAQYFSRPCASRCTTAQPKIHVFRDLWRLKTGRSWRDGFIRNVPSLYVCVEREKERSLQPRGQSIWIARRKGTPHIHSHTHNSQRQIIHREIFHSPPRLPGLRRLGEAVTQPCDWRLGRRAGHVRSSGVLECQSVWLLSAVCETARASQTDQRKLVWQCERVLSDRSGAGALFV